MWMFIFYYQMDTIGGMSNVISERLKELRRVNNVTQQDVADAIDIGRVSYGRYETGSRTPTSEVLVSLASYFKCTTDYLLGLVDRPEVVNWTDLPSELKDEGIEAIQIAKVALEEGLTAQDLKDIIELSRKLERKK